MSGSHKRKKKRKKASQVPRDTGADPPPAHDKPTASPEQQEPTKSDGIQMNTPTRWRHKPDWTLPTLIVGVVVATIYFFQLRAMQQQYVLTKQTVDASERNFRVQQRPYVFLDFAQLQGALEEGKKLPIAVFLKNSGRTPAIEVAVDTKFYDANGQYVPGVRLTNSGSIAPSDRVLREGYAVTLSSDLTKFRQSTEAMTIRGTITYRDIFNEWHSSTYCYIYDAVHDSWWFCPTGNDIK